MKPIPDTPQAGVAVIIGAGTYVFYRERQITKRAKRRSGVLEYKNPKID